VAIGREAQKGRHGKRWWGRVGCSCMGDPFRAKRGGKRKGRLKQKRGRGGLNRDGEQAVQVGKVYMKRTGGK